MSILVTGGLGYIGSHTIVELVQSNYNQIIIVDNLQNTTKDVFDKIKTICASYQIKLVFIELDIVDKMVLQTEVFDKYNIYAIIHFASLKSVSESIEYPLEYYHKNIIGALNLLSMCKQYNVKHFIFSSSATVYGNEKSPLCETDQIGIGITNPYGHTKYMIEQILADVSRTGLTTICLRYFNPVGAHSTGLLGETLQGTPTNLMPYLLKVAIQNNTEHYFGPEYDYLTIFGQDYSTVDGTCERDFIHVVDLAKGHVAVLDKMSQLEGKHHAFNLGTGVPTTVLHVVKTFEEVNNVKIPVGFSKRRQGDVQTSYCNHEYTYDKINWKTEKSLRDICIDVWRKGISSH
jgi:UDP-glucose 4-epimerase